MPDDMTREMTAYRDKLALQFLVEHHGTDLLRAPIHPTQVENFRRKADKVIAIPHPLAEELEQARAETRALAGELAVLRALPAGAVTQNALKDAVSGVRFEHFGDDDTPLGACVLVKDLSAVLTALGVPVEQEPGDRG